MVTRQRGFATRHFMVSQPLTDAQETTFLDGASLPVMEGTTLSGTTATVRDAATGGSTIGTIALQEMKQWLGPEGNEVSVSGEDDDDTGSGYQSRSTDPGLLDYTVTANVVFPKRAVDNSAWDVFNMTKQGVRLLYIENGAGYKFIGFVRQTAMPVSSPVSRITSAVTYRSAGPVAPYVGY